MVVALAKLALVATLGIQAVLWSQSRQATVDLRSFSSHPKPSISSAITNILLVDTDEPDTCKPLTVPVEKQCKHVKESCESSNTILHIPYLNNYYCAPPSLRTGHFVGLVVWLAFLFSTLGIVASDFFCPNLGTISHVLGLEENVAGVTFLAFGNGSPDVFSTFSAMKANSGSLAIGELLGAASFIVSVVVGSMSIIKPFKVHKGPFLRDVGFFTVAVGSLLIILMDGLIRSWEAGVLVVLYTAYVSVVVVGSWWERRQERRRIKEQLLRSEYGPEDPISEPYRDEPIEPYRDEVEESTSNLALTSPTVGRRLRAHSTPGRPPPSFGETENRMHLSLHIPETSSSVRQRRPSLHSRSPSQQLPSFSLLGALEFRSVVNSLKQQSNAANLNIFETSPITPFAAGHYHHPRAGTPQSHYHEDHLTGDTGSERNPWEETLGVPLDNRHRSPERDREDSLSPPAAESSLRPWIDRGKSPVPSISVQNEEGDFRSPSQDSFPSTVHEPVLRSKRARFKRIFWQTFHTFFPTLEDFPNKGFVGMVVALFATPAVLALTLTLPVVVTPMGDPPTEEKGMVVGAGGDVGATGELIDFEEDGIERTLVAEDIVEEELRGLQFNKWLMAIQCIFGPLFCAIVLFTGTEKLQLALLVAGIGGTSAGILVALFANEGNDPGGRVFRCAMGFFVAIIWIMAIADEVVQVLQTFGTIFGLSDAIIGLTIFAVGNSLADFVANITVAAFAPIMGFSACFGGPMLNILLGVGLSGSYVIQQTGQDYMIHFSTTLLVSSIGLLTLLLLTMIVVPWNGYFLTRKWGMFLILSYLTIMTINIVVELRGENSSSIWGT